MKYAVIMDDIKNINLYELLEISPSAQTADIKKAYRKKALTCHPDKNPDNPNAVKLFLQLSKALEILLDDAARTAYDKVLNAKHVNEIRNRELSDERKRFKQKLEEREQQLANQNYNSKSAEDKLQKEIERLRKEGSKQAEEEAKRVRQMLIDQLKESYCSNCRVKITWKADKDDAKNGGYDRETLQKMLSSYGKIEALLVSSKKNGSALAEFSSPEGAERAKLLVSGLPSNPLKLKIIGSKEEETKQQMAPNVEKTTQGGRSSLFPCFTAAKNTVFTQGPSSTDDFETEVLLRLKQAQERKNMIQNLENDDEEI